MNHSDLIHIVHKDIKKIISTKYLQREKKLLVIFLFSEAVRNRKEEELNHHFMKEVFSQHELQQFRT